MTITHVGVAARPVGGAFRATARLVVVAGVPGAGKSTALRGVSALATSTSAGDAWPVVLDSDRYRTWLAARLPARMPYRWFRPLTHVLHQAGLVALLVAGPGSRLLAGRTLLVHDPGTRGWWRYGVGRLARARGWRASLVYIDVDRVEALRGQLARGRVLDAASFEGHWRRWEELRGAIAIGAGDRPGTTLWPGWDRVRATTRDQAVQTLLAESGAADQAPAAPGGPAWRRAS